jgi:hypothetical protein
MVTVEDLEHFTSLGERRRRAIAESASMVEPPV